MEKEIYLALIESCLVFILMHILYSFDRIPNVKIAKNV